jgi:hypothetical protein
MNHAAGTGLRNTHLFSVCVFCWTLEHCKCSRQEATYEVLQYVALMEQFGTVTWWFLERCHFNSVAVWWLLLLCVHHEFRCNRWVLLEKIFKSETCCSWPLKSDLEREMFEVWTNCSHDRKRLALMSPLSLEFVLLLLASMRKGWPMIQSLCPASVPRAATWVSVESVYTHTHSLTFQRSTFPFATWQEYC